MDHTWRASPSYGPRSGRDGGFTLAEVMVSLGLFALIAVGSLGILGSVEVGGPLAAAPTAVGAVRLARDHTAAALYLHAVQEVLSARTAAQLPPGTYCRGEDCPPSLPFPDELADVPPPPTGPSQISRLRLLVTVEHWHWDASAEGHYCLVGSPGCGAGPASEFLTRVRSTLTWEFRGFLRTLTLTRFIP